MAKKDSAGNIVGSIGNLITYVVGKQVRVRSKPSQINMPQTEGVIKTKSRFKLANSLAKKLYHSSEFLGTERTSKSTDTVYNSLMSLILKTSIKENEDKTVAWDWENLQFSDGRLAVPEIQWEIQEDILLLRWDKNMITESHAKEIVFIQIDEATTDVQSRRFPVIQEQGEMPFGVIRPALKRKTMLYTMLIKQKSTTIHKSKTKFLGALGES